MDEFSLIDYVGKKDDMGNRPIRISSRPSNMLPGKFFTHAQNSFDDDDILDSATSNTQSEAEVVHGLMVLKYSEF